MDRSTYESWSENGGTTLKERARRKVAEILNTHKPEPIEENVTKEIERIIQTTRTSE
jgi:trimethylamine:corrinoid methyltransferase-like protein